MDAVDHGADWVFCDGDGGALRKSNCLRRSFKPLVKEAGGAAISALCSDQRPDRHLRQRVLDGVGAPVEVHLQPSQTDPTAWPEPPWEEAQEVLK